MTFLRHVDFAPAVFALGPNLGQIQLMIQQSTPGRSAPDEKHADLAVVSLAEPTAVLPLYADTLDALLGEARAVEDADGADRPRRSARHQFFGVDRLDFVLDVLVVPRRVRKKPLQAKDLVLAN